MQAVFPLTALALLVVGAALYNLYDRRWLAWLAVLSALGTLFVGAWVAR